MATSKDTTTTPCGWCTAAIPAGEDTCPDCGASAVKDGIEVPGLTSVTAELQVADARVSAHLERLSHKPLVHLITG